MRGLSPVVGDGEKVDFSLILVFSPRTEHSRFICLGCFGCAVALVVCWSVGMRLCYMYFYLY